MESSLSHHPLRPCPAPYRNPSFSPFHHPAPYPSCHQRHHHSALSPWDEPLYSHFYRCHFAPSPWDGLLFAHPHRRHRQNYLPSFPSSHLLNDVLIFSANLSHDPPAPLFPADFSHDPPVPLFPVDFSHDPPAHHPCPDRRHRHCHRHGLAHPDREESSDRR